MVYHTACVARGAKRAFIIGDMPFGTFQVSPAGHVPQRRRDHGGGRADGQARGRPADAGDHCISRPQRGMPVCGHLGLTPQSVHQLGGYRVQGRSEDDAAAPARRGAASGAGGRRHDRARSDSRGAGERDHRRSGMHADHRHRRRRGLLRAGAGAARHARHLSGQEGEVRQELHARRRHRSTARSSCMSRKSRRGPFPGPSTRFRDSGLRMRIAGGYTLHCLRYKA